MPESGPPSSLVSPSRHLRRSHRRSKSDLGSRPYSLAAVYSVSNSAQPFPDPFRCVWPAALAPELYCSFLGRRKTCACYRLKTWNVPSKGRVVACDAEIDHVLYSIDHMLPYVAQPSSFGVVEHMVLVAGSDSHLGRRKDSAMRVVVAQRDDCLVPRRPPSCRLLFV